MKYKKGSVLKPALFLITLHYFLFTISYFLFTFFRQSF